MDEPAGPGMRQIRVLLLMAASGLCGLAASAAEPVIAWLAPEVVRAGRIPDDPEWKEAAQFLPAWWMELPNVTAPALPPSAKPDEAWVAVHVFHGGGESAFVHAGAPTIKQAARTALHMARREEAVGNTRAEQLTIFLGRRKVVIDAQILPYSDWGEPVARGRAGFLCYDGESIQDAISPFHVLRRNEVRFRPLLQKGDQLPEWHVYTGRQFLLNVSSDPVAMTELLRGKPVVKADAITRTEVGKMADGAAGWLLRNVDTTGRLPYRITLAENLESPAQDSENELRQWMATRALIAAAVREKSASAMVVARLNVESNLRRFYRDEDDYGVIEAGGQVKLGAVALAALALREFPDAPPEWREKEERLERLVSFLWRNDGSFRTFLRPTARAEENQNFYSGEALLYWGTRLAETREESLQNRFNRSTAYYRAWHLRQRNPAFVPWHTMAIVAAWPRTREEPGAAWVFEMNDWLLQVQQPEGAPGHPDTAGRFYAPSRDFGPPHASSTGVYLEGLCDAFKLAGLVGDEARAMAYAQAIRRGLRSARQLQFTEPVDWLGLTDRQRQQCQGAFRTTEYDNTIRCDNVQHIFQACLAVLKLPRESGILAD